MSFQSAAAWWLKATLLYRREARKCSSVSRSRLLADFTLSGDFDDRVEIGEILRDFYRSRYSLPVSAADNNDNDIKQFMRRATINS